MKVYKANIIFYYVTALGLMLYISACLIYNFKLYKVVVGMLFLNLIFLLVMNVKERLVKIITDSDDRVIILEKTKMFGAKKNIIKVDIDNINCDVYKRPGGRGRVTCFKIESNDKKMNFEIEYSDGWSPEDFKNIIKDINRISAL